VLNIDSHWSTITDVLETRAIYGNPEKVVSVNTYPNLVYELGIFFILYTIFFSKPEIDE
jgi:hypothetical protein